MAKQSYTVRKPRRVVSLKVCQRLERAVIAREYRDMRANRMYARAMARVLESWR